MFYFEGNNSTTVHVSKKVFLLESEVFNLMN